MFKTSSSGSNAGMETSVLQVNGIANSALFHSSPRINQMLPHIVISFTSRTFV